MTKKQLITTALAATLLGGCSAPLTAGTAWDSRIHSTDKAEVQAACADRVDKGLLLQTVGFFTTMASIVVSPAIQSAKAIGAEGMQNPTTLSLNEECKKVSGNAE